MHRSWRSIDKGTEAPSAASRNDTGRRNLQVGATRGRGGLTCGILEDIRE
jgi:hypothetical protein